MNGPDNGNRPRQTPEEAMAGRQRLVREFFVHFSHMPGLTPEGLIGLEEAIHGQIEFRSANELEDFMAGLLEEIPGLGHIIEGTGDISVLNVLTRIAKGETNLPINPLSANRFERTEDVLSAV